MSSYGEGISKYIHSPTFTPKHLIRNSPKLLTNSFLSSILLIMEIFICGQSINGLKDYILVGCGIILIFIVALVMINSYSKRDIKNKED